MNQAPSTFDLRGAIMRIVPHVFDTMLSLTAALAPSPPSAAGERVSGTIGIAGDALSGAVYLHFSEALAHRAAVAMLGLGSPADADAGAVNDVASELANMIGGGLKSTLCDAGYPCGMSTPAIVRGPACVIELPPGMQSESFAFDCQGECLVVDIHLKLE